MTVDVSTTQSPVTVSVNDTAVDVTVSGGIGPQGPQGPAGGGYTLPAATTTTLGGIIVGSNLTVTANGTLSATGGGAVSSVAGRTGAVTLTTADVSGYTAPPVSSVAGRTGTVTLTTADVSGYVAPQVFSVAGRTGTVTLTTSDISGYTSPPVSSVAGRTGTVTLNTSDISGLGTLATQSGTFSGTSSGTNTGDQTISLTGDVTGSGTGSFAATLAASGATAGTYTSVTVDTKGRVTAGTNPSGYSLPTATASVLGGIKIGSGLSIDGSGVVTAAGTYTLPNATVSTLGGVIVGSGLSVSSGTLSANVTSVAGRSGAVTIAYSDLSGTPSTFAPSTHASSHASGGSDAISIAASQITSGVIAVARLGTGATSTNFLRGDGTFATAGSSSASDLTSGTLADARLSANSQNATNLYLWSSFR